MQTVDVLIGELQTLLNERSRRIPTAQKLMEVLHGKSAYGCMFEAVQTILSKDRSERLRSLAP